MPGGLMQLVAYGAQDIYLTGNPQITFFKVVYRRHTNFSMESIKQVFEGNVDYGQEVSCTISRNGDLVHRMYLEHDATLTHAIVRTSDKANQVSLVERYGDSLIKLCEVEIGGQLIDRHTSMWNRVYSDLTEYNPSGYILDVGKDGIPTDGINSSLVNLMKGNSNGYNTGEYDYDATDNISNTRGAGVDSGNKTLNGFTYTNGQSGQKSEIVVNKIFIPLNFWFNRNPGLALPLIALQYHEVKIRMEFESDDRLARYGGFSAATGKDPADEISHTQDPNDSIHHSYAIPIRADSGEQNTKMQGNFNLWCDYIYLDTDERRRFAQVSHEYLIDQLQIKTTTLSKSTEKIKLNFNHPVKELIWTMRNETLVRDQSPGSDYGLGGRHGFFSGVTGNDQYDGVNGAIPGNHRGDASSGPVSLDEMGGNWQLKLNGKERFKPRDTKYFTRTQVWQHHTGVGGLTSSATGGTDGNLNDGIAVYSFALKPEEHQPSGTCNFSRIDTAQLVNGSAGAYNADTIFAVNYNVLRIMSGMGGLAYSN